MHFVHGGKKASPVSLAPVNPFWPFLDARGDDFYDSFDKDGHRRKRKGGKKKRRVHSVTQAWKDNKVCRIIEETYSTNLLNTPIQVHLFNPRMNLKLKGCFFSVNYYYRFKGRESCYRRFFLNSCQNCPPYLHRLAVYDADCTLQGMSTILPWKATLWTRATWRRCACKNGHYTNPRRRERERERAYSIWMIMWKIRFLPERREIRYFGY